MRLLNKIKKGPRQLSSEELVEAYPTTGNCPVSERTGDGHTVGRCEFALFGGICPRHGDLNELLVVKGDGISTYYVLIDENILPPREQRNFGPPGLFTSPRR